MHYIFLLFYPTEGFAALMLSMAESFRSIAKVSQNMIIVPSIHTFVIFGLFYVFSLSLNIQRLIFQYLFRNFACTGMLIYRRHGRQMKRQNFCKQSTDANLLGKETLQ